MTATAEGGRRTGAAALAALRRSYDPTTILATVLLAVACLATSPADTSDRTSDGLGGTSLVGLRQIATGVALFFLSGVLAQVFAAQWDGVPHLVMLAVGAAILVTVALVELAGRAPANVAGTSPSTPSVPVPRPAV